MAQKVNGSHMKAVFTKTFAVRQWGAIKFCAGWAHTILITSIMITIPFLCWSKKIISNVNFEELQKYFYKVLYEKNPSLWSKK